MFAKQSTALTLIVGPILDSAGAEYTGAVIGDLSISKNGGTLTALAAAATLTHIANGQYTLVLTTGNTDTLGVIQVTCNKSTYQMPTVERHVIPANVYDSLVLGSDTLDVNTLTSDAAVVSAIQSGLATSAALTTLLDRIGGFAGTGVNNILGFLRAIMRSDASVPSDVGGTFASSTDSLEASANAIDTIENGIVISASSSVLDTIDDGGNITLRRGDRVSFSLTLGNVTGRSGEKLFFTIKRQNTNDTDDSNAIVQITETTGAVLVNGSSTGVTAADASITVSNETTGVTVFVIQDSITTMFPVGSGWHYDVQMIRSDGKAVTMTYGSVSIVADTTRRKTI